MKLFFFTAAMVLLLSIDGYSQTKYGKGYIINNENEKIEGLIQNEGWRINPAEIEVKYAEGGESETVGIEDIQEFGINGKLKFQRANIPVDKSRESVSTLGHNRNPSFEEEQVLLKVLVEGEATLYSYEGKNFKNYFYKTATSGIEPLVYKRYLNKENRIAENNQYKQQLFNSLRCPGLSLEHIEYLQYKSGELIDLFVQYNQCSDADYSVYSVEDQKTKIHVSLKAGLQYSSLEIKNSESHSRDTDFGHQLGFRFGVEAEFVLPFHKNKWSLLLEPTYQNFISQKETPNLVSEVNYHSIEVPFGVRHSFFLDKDSRLFLNVLVIMDFNFDSNFHFERQSIPSDLELKSGTNMAIGFGYNYDKKYSIELRYHSSRDLLTNYGPWDSDYNNLAVILGYSLF